MALPADASMRGRGWWGCSRRGLHEALLPQSEPQQRFCKSLLCRAADASRGGATEERERAEAPEEELRRKARELRSAGTVEYLPSRHSR